MCAGASASPFPWGDARLRKCPAPTVASGAIARADLGFGDRLSCAVGSDLGDPLRVVSGGDAARVQIAASGALALSARPGPLPACAITR